MNELMMNDGLVHLRPNGTLPRTEEEGTEHFLYNTRMGLGLCNPT